MKIMSVQSLDESGRVLLPSALGAKIDLKENNQLTPFVNLADKTIILSKQQGGEFVLDKFNRVTITKELCNELQWGDKDNLAVTLDTTEKTISLSLYKKYSPECIFCKKPEAALTINGIGICGPHVSEILNEYKK